MTNITKSYVARAVPFDKTGTDFISDDVQSALEEIGVSSSPSFSFGRSGKVGSGTWLQCETVPSNITGRFIPLNNPKLSDVYVSNENVGTYTVEVYEHDGDNTNLTLKYTLTVTSARGNSISNIGVPMTKGKQVAVRIGSGSPKNVVCGLIIKGSQV